MPMFGQFGGGQPPPQGQRMEAPPNLMQQRAQMANMQRGMGPPPARPAGIRGPAGINDMPQAGQFGRPMAGPPGGMAGPRGAMPQRPGMSGPPPMGGAQFQGAKPPPPPGMGMQAAGFRPRPPMGGMPQAGPGGGMAQAGFGKPRPPMGGGPGAFGMRQAPQAGGQFGQMTKGPGMQGRMQGAFGGQMRPGPFGSPR